MQPVQINRILAPTDFSEHSACALRYARTFADNWGAELHLLNVVEPAVYPTETVLAPMGMLNLDTELTAAAERALHELLQREELVGVDNVVTAIAHGRASSAIIEYATDHGIDLVVLATHGRAGLEHLIFGSTAERVVRESPCPVLTIRPAQQ
ncbi:MAG: universal stress protein [bacterium]|nr:universal stress protein [Candidatus Kapabacteria bacterium]